MKTGTIIIRESYLDSDPKSILVVLKDIGHRYYCLSIGSIYKNNININLHGSYYLYVDRINFFQLKKPTKNIIKSVMMWIDNKLINKSEVARQIGISTILFRMKLKYINRNRFTSDELKKLDEVRTKLLNST